MEGEQQKKVQRAATISNTPVGDWVEAGQAENFDYVLSLLHDAGHHDAHGFLARHPGRIRRRDEEPRNAEGPGPMMAEAKSADRALREDR